MTVLTSVAVCRNNCPAPSMRLAAAKSRQLPELANADDLGCLATTVCPGTGMDTSNCLDCQWSELPSNVLLRITGCLSLPELCTAGRVCSAWHAVVGSDSLWSSLLQQHCGLSTPLGSSGSCRHTLLQLRTSSIWATGNFKADTTCVTPGLLVPPSAVIPLSVSGTEFLELWSAQQSRSVSNSSQSSESPATSAFFEHKCQLPQGFAASAVAAGSNHLVLLGCSGSVVDTRGAFVKESQPDAQQKQDAATELLAWLLQQQGQTDPGADPDQHWAAVVGRLREGHNISMRNPWLPPNGIVITSVASGRMHTSLAARVCISLRHTLAHSAEQHARLMSRFAPNCAVSSNGR